MFRACVGQVSNLPYDRRQVANLPHMTGLRDSARVTVYGLGADRTRPEEWRNNGARGAAETKEGQEAGKQGAMPPAHQQLNDHFPLRSIMLVFPAAGMVGAGAKSDAMLDKVNEQRRQDGCE